MARSLRIMVTEAWYYVINRGIERRKIFLSKEYYQKFERLLETAVQQNGMKVHSYVLIPNHYHLQLETPRGNLSEAVQWINLSYMIWYNRNQGRVRPLFQGRFKAIIHDRQENGASIPAGGISYSAVSEAIRRTERKLKAESHYKKQFKKILKYMKIEIRPLL